MERKTSHHLPAGENNPLTSEAVVLSQRINTPLAHSLINLHYKYNGLGVNEEDTYSKIEGVRTTFPFQTEVEEASWNDYIPSEVMETYDVCSRIMNPETMPQAWKDLLKEADQMRIERGSDMPLDIINGIFFLSLESKRYKKLGLPQFELDGELGPKFSNEAQIREAITGAVKDRKLRGDLRDELAIQIPDVGLSDLDMQAVNKVIKNLGVEENNGILLDLGCGMGNRTAKWHEATGVKTIGLDRAYREKWYGPIWNDGQNENIRFMRADFIQGIPLADDAIDVVVMEDVVAYILEDKLAVAIGEVTRILKPDRGLFFVGPQETDDKNRRWRMFRKELSDQSGKHRLSEYSLGDAVQGSENK